MAKDGQGSVGSGTADNAGKVADQFRGKRGQRKSYGHQMSEADKFALRQVQAARSALQKVSVAIQSGKQIDAGIVESCSNIITAAGKMLFR